MCQRLQQTLVQKEKLRESKKNVKDIEARIRVSQPLLPIRKHSKEYDASQQALNTFLKDNPVGGKFNGGREQKYTADILDKKEKKRYVELKLFKDLDESLKMKKQKRELSQQFSSIISNTHKVFQQVQKVDQEEKEPVTKNNTDLTRDEDEPQNFGQATSMQYLRTVQ